IGNDIARIFKTDVDTKKPFAHSHVQPNLGAHAVVRCRPGMAAEAARIADIVADVDEFEGIEKAHRLRCATRQLESENRPACLHLMHRKIVLRMAGKPWMKDARDASLD